MSHAFPLARTARAALAGTQTAARTRAEAEDAANGAVIAGLETEWLTPPASALPGLLKQAEENPADGFLQHYEDAAGNTVLAVTYWKLAPAKAKKPALTPAPVPKPAGDHTDDLYFRHRRRSKARKAKPVDPNQMDMFSAEKPPKPS